MIRHLPPCARGRVVLNLECAPDTRPRKEEHENKGHILREGYSKTDKLDPGA